MDLTKGGSMTLSDAELEARIAAVTERVTRAKSAPASSAPVQRTLDRLDRDLAASKTTQNRHLRLLSGASRSGMDDALRGLKRMERGGATVKGLREVLADSISGFNAFVSAMESTVDGLKSDLASARAEAKALRDELAGAPKSRRAPASVNNFFGWSPALEAEWAERRGTDAP
jgi:hypothetical protein